MSSKEYDVIIIGAGPSGIFAAMELYKQKNGLKILVLEKGKDINQRKCFVKSGESSCLHCKPCLLICGFGGAGAFSDGKLTLSPQFGGVLSDYVSSKVVEELINYVDQEYLSYGAPADLYGADDETTKDLKRQAATADLNLIPAQIRHLGTENCNLILTRMREKLEQQIDIRTSEGVREVLVEDGKARGVLTEEDQTYFAPCVICGPGRAGAEWFLQESKKLGLKGVNNPVDIGVRVEVPGVTMEHLTAKLYESKLVYYSPSFDDRVRTFCMNPFGEVVAENNNGLITVNGHSYAHKQTANTNFALLVSKMFTEPFREPIRYGKYIASLANMLGDGVLIQRLGDLLEGRRSTQDRIDRGLVTPTMPQATPGDLSLVLPYRHLTSLLEMLEALDKVAPGVNSRHTLLYGVEVKFYSYRLELTPALETQIENLFAVGDGAGVTRGLVQASASGVIAAREVLERMEN